MAPPSLISNTKNLRRHKRDVTFDYVPAPSEMVGPVIDARGLDSEDGEDERTDFDNFEKQNRKREK